MLNVEMSVVLNKTMPKKPGDDLIIKITTQQVAAWSLSYWKTKCGVKTERGKTAYR